METYRKSNPVRMTPRTTMGGPGWPRWVIIGLLLLTFQLVSCANLTAEARLYQELTTGRMLARPAPNSWETVTVQVDLQIIQINGLDSATQELTIVGGFILSWTDETLTWNPADYGNIYHTYIPSTSVWKPEFCIRNSVSSDFYNDDWDRMRLMVFSQGHVIWSPSGQFSTSCEINAFYLPFDTQTCQLVFTNMDATAEYNNFTALDPEPNTQLMIPSNEWTLLDTSTSENYKQYTGYSISEVIFSLKLRRQSSYFTFTIILPAMGLSFVGLMVFPLPPDSGEKISLSVACMMAFFITQISITERLPSSWNAMPLIMIFNFFLMTMNVLSVCLTVLILALYFKDPVPEPPTWVARLFIKQATTPVEETSVKKMDAPCPNCQCTKGKVLNQNLEKWKDIARAINKISFFVVLFAIIIMGLVCLILWTKEY